eukprot:CAMPEP_0197909958 /NCGR_PEP_ID=MMETSP1439-20131203/69967_1 /TAXON_ID=66791 /ORGANISM="Gonyaulax spinifera, Strain CCMP409" /LENGTH=113 /DNA_ID=CAMNT_0043531571 /DNA_START=49 /DNA_END=386 /DNA_ORIENTATION=+
MTPKSQTRPRREVVAQEAPDRSQLFSKTKLCKFELRGLCTRGSNCCFAHGREELKDLPDLRCTKLCITLLQTGFCCKDDCSFAHNRQELRQAGNGQRRSSRKEQRAAAQGGSV